MKGEFQLHPGDCLEALRVMPDNSVDSIVTDPPYGLAFMGKRWDCDVPSVEIWAECLRVLKPGGHLLAFAGTRTQHRMAVRIEDAGFEIRDMIAWVYGSGFPKSMDVGRAIDKAESKGTTRTEHDEAEGGGFTEHGTPAPNPLPVFDPRADVPIPYIDRPDWDGWGTALKPALEPITVARKPFKGTVAANVLAHGTGALNIDACRVPPTGERLGGGGEKRSTFEKADGWSRPWMSDPEHSKAHADKVSANVGKATELGRWPANLIHDGSDEVVGLFPVTGPSSGSPRVNKNSSSIGTFKTADRVTAGVSDSGGSAARFFYCAKASKKDRGDGNNHPTVKPTDLMAYLCRLITPPGGVVLDPFMGSGSTGKAAMREGFRFIGCELSPEYLAIAERRIKHELAKRVLAEQEPDSEVEQTDLFAVAAE